jgi:hypothetical protein
MMIENASDVKRDFPWPLPVFKVLRSLRSIGTRGLMMGMLVMVLVLGGSWAYAQGSASGEASGSKWEFNVIHSDWGAVFYRAAF